MAAGDVLAHRGGRDLVVADRAHHPAPRRFQRLLRQPDQCAKHDHEEQEESQLHRDRRSELRIHAPALRLGDEFRAVLQVDLIGNRPGARDAVDVEHAAVKPLLVLEHRHEDLGNPERRDGEIVRAQTQGRLAHEPGRPSGQDCAHGPGDQRRQAEPAEVALRRGVDRLDRFDRRVEGPAISEESRDQHGRHREPAQAARYVAPDPDRRQHRDDGDEEGKHDAKAPRLERTGRRRHRDQHGRETAKREEPHRARVEQPRIAPLHVHPKRHDRAQKAHVQNAERRVPARGEALEQDQHGHDGEEERRAHRARFTGLSCGAHTIFPLKRPVGLKISTRIRIVKLTAYL